MGAAMLSDWMEQKGYKVAWMPDPADALEAATSEVGALDEVIPTGG
jgi:DNA-binding response OmpR family regulator